MSENQHEFVGTLITCLKCCKAKHDPVHLMNKQAVPLLLNDITAYNIIGEPTETKAERSNLSCISESSETLCIGHTCPSCKKIWTHNYNCSATTDRQGLCIDCAQQAAAQINRPAHIAEMTTKLLTPAECTQLQLDHEQFVVLNIVHLPDGSDNPNWAQDLALHIQDIERTIEKYKIKASGANRARASKEVEELNKLTDEQREQFLRDAAKGKVPKVKEPKDKDTPLTGTKREKAILSLLKMINKTDTPENRKFIMVNMLGEEE